MSARPCESTMLTPADVASALLDLPRRQKVVLVMDLVESVRLIGADEVGVLEQWLAFVRFARGSVFARRNGRLVKSLGDGLMAEFDDARDAVLAALELHRHFEGHNATCAPTSRLLLRAGIHATQVYVDEIDIYGAGVNIAARVASIALPGDTLVTAEVRDQLADRVDVDVSDLGQCHLKHIAEPIRAYRVSAAGTASAYSLPPDRTTFAACVAVIPFARIRGNEGDFLGDAMADEVIASLSHLRELCVISRLSTTGLKSAMEPLAAAARLLRADFVVSGSYTVVGDSVVIRAQMAETQNGGVLWADTISARVCAILEGDDPVLAGLTAAVTRCILQFEVEKVRSLPLPVMEGYSLYLASISLLHRLVRADFLRAKDLLEHLVARHPRSASPKALLAKWHLLFKLQGWSQDTKRALEDAQGWAQRAIDDQSDHAFALSMSGLIMAHQGRDLGEALGLCEAATRANPQEPNAWLALGGIRSYRGEADAAESTSLQAVRLSPIDPARFLYDVFVAASKIVCRKYGDAAKAARNSIRLNAMHPASHRLLTISLALDGQLTEAQAAARVLMRVDPSFTVSGYMRSYAGKDGAHRREREAALLQAGLPQ